MIKLVEVCESNRYTDTGNGKQYSLREVFINPGHVVCIRSDTGFKQKLKEGKLPEGIDSRQEFSRVYLNRGQVGLDIVIVGAPTFIEQKLKNTTPQPSAQRVLKG